MVRLRGWDPRVSGVSPLPAQKGPGVPHSRSSLGRLAPATTKCKVGPARGSAWIPVGSFSAGVAGVSLVGPSCPFLARLPRPDGFNPRSLLPPPFVLWPWGREAEVEGGVSLFFRSSPSCRKQHQMTRMGSTAPLPEAAAAEPGEFPGRRAGVEEQKERKGSPNPPSQQA